jgi:protein phosphatase
MDAKLGRHANVLRAAIRIAHERVLKAIRQDTALHGMGTTVVGLVLDGDTAAVAHVGDSRAYRVRNGKLELLTQDHTWVNEQVVAGFLSEEQARVHPLKNVVTRALGGDAEVDVDVREWKVAPGDVFLLCSDGLTTMLNDQEILDRLRGSARLEEACGRLVRDANSRGGFDNVSVVLVRIEHDATDDDDTDFDPAGV